MLAWKELWYRRFNPDEIQEKLRAFEEMVVPALQAAASRVPHNGYPLVIDHGLTEDDIDALYPIVVPPYWTIPHATSEEREHVERLRNLWQLFVNPVQAITIGWSAPSLYGITKDGRHRLMAAKLLPEEFTTIPAWVYAPVSLSAAEEAVTISAEEARSILARLWKRIVEN